MINYDLNTGRERRGNMTLAILMVAYHKIKNPNATQTELEQTARECLCEFCRQGIPIENGNHIILDAEIPCEAS